MYNKLLTNVHLLFYAAAVVRISTASTVLTGNATSTFQATITECLNVRGQVITNRKFELQCCQLFSNRYKLYWFREGNYLTEALETLKTWRCPEFEEDCTQRIYGFTEFTQRVYDRACNRTLFESACLPTVFRVLSDAGVNVTDQNWRHALRNVQLEMHALQYPCIQVALYDAVSAARQSSYGFYHETVHLHTPFCHFVWVGFDAETTVQHSIFPWLFLRTDKSRTSQDVYKASIAMADLIVGVFVIPSFAYSVMIIQLLHQENLGPAHPGLTNFTVPDVEKGRYDSVPHLPYTRPTDNNYVIIIGFFTILAFLSSIYSLMLASFDRLSVVRRPLRYVPDAAKSFANKAVAIEWFIAVVFSLIPFMTTSITYGIIAFVLVGFSGGTETLLLYAVALLTPLLLIWASSIATCCYTFSHARQRGAKNFQMELNLTRTIGILVVVFTLSVVPAVVSTLCSLLLPGILRTRPATLDQELSISLITFEFLSVVVLTCNSMWNVFIYSARNTSFKTGLESLYRSAFSKVGIPFKTNSIDSTSLPT
nr:uncharacterized protein LOC104265481 isoform X2 [Ciona intestinalis]|eukprot:XP_009857865.1 uncharacterized protein LOC104265481 isoform X2 [Ciona intestinalis]